MAFVSYPLGRKAVVAMYSKAVMRKKQINKFKQINKVKLSSNKNNSLQLPTVHLSTNENINRNLVKQVFKNQ